MVLKARKKEEQEVWKRLQKKKLLVSQLSIVYLAN